MADWLTAVCALLTLSVMVVHFRNSKRELHAIHKLYEEMSKLTPGKARKAPSREKKL